MILVYARATGQEPALAAAPEWLFLDALLAALSAGSAGVLRAWPEPLVARGLPLVRWRHRRLAAEELPVAFPFSTVEAVALYRDLVDLARERLT